MFYLFVVCFIVCLLLFIDVCFVFLRKHCQNRDFLERISENVKKMTKNTAKIFAGL